MKKIVSAALSLIILSSLTACNTTETTAETTKAKTIIYTSDTVETTTESTTEETEGPDLLDLSINDISKKLLNVIGEDYRVSGFMESKYAKDNKSLGVLNYQIISNEDWSLKKKVDGYDTYKVYIYVIEYDTESAVYKDLHVGKSLQIVSDGAKVKTVATQIAKQYVLCIELQFGKDKIITNKTKNTQAPFSLTELQAGYESFTELVPIPDGTTRASLEYITRDILKKIGRTNKDINTDYQTEELAEKNAESGILNYVYIWNKGLKVKVYIFEFDMQSETYNNLKVGQKLVFDDGGKKAKSLKVTAINNQYVLCLFTEGKKAENQAPFKDEMAKNIYNTFINEK